jgi:hypothetical protein
MRCASTRLPLTSRLFSGLLLVIYLSSVYQAEGISGYQSTSPVNQLPALETLPFDMQNCVPFYQAKLAGKQLVVSDEGTLRSYARTDMSAERCLRHIRQIDFSKHTLLGIEINSGWCGVPLGLTYQNFKDEAKKQYLFVLTYTASGEPCRALSQYALWVLVPKLPPAYEVIFQVKPKP